MKKFRLIVYTVIIATIFTSCAYLFNAIVLPKQCKKCDIIDTFTNQVVSSDEGCGGGMTNIEENSKVKAYDMNVGNSQIRYEVNCTTWRDTSL